MAVITSYYFIKWYFICLRGRAILKKKTTHNMCFMKRLGISPHIRFILMHLLVCSAGAAFEQDRRRSVVSSCEFIPGKTSSVLCSGEDVSSNVPQTLPPNITRLWVIIIVLSVVLHINTPAVRVLGCIYIYITNVCVCMFFVCMCPSICAFLCVKLYQNVLFKMCVRSVA